MTSARGSVPACQTVGWVMDQATSRRRLHVHLLLGKAGIAVTIETGTRGGQTVVLDVEGASYLQGLLGAAVRRMAREHEAEVL